MGEPRDDLDYADLLVLWRKSDDELQALLEGSPMERTGVVKLRRNLAVALGNAVGCLSADAIDGDDDPARPTIRIPIVASHVVWARQQLQGDEHRSRPTGRAV